MTGNPTDLHVSGMTQEEASALSELRCHWADVYVITWIDGIWVAVRREYHDHQEPDAPMLRAGSAVELKAEMQNDFGRWTEGSAEDEGMYRRLEQILKDAERKELRVSVTSDESGSHHLEVVTR